MAETVSDVNGGDNDYATLALWEADKNGDITAANAEVAELYGSLEVGGHICNLQGWTTDADSYWGVRVPDAQRRSSTDPLRVAQGVYIKQTYAWSRWMIGVGNGAEYGLIEGLEIYGEQASDAYPCININITSEGPGLINISDCVMAHLGAAKDIGIYGYIDASDNGLTVNIWNTVVYTSTEGIFLTKSGSGAIFNVYNCTIHGCSLDGVEENTGTVVCNNVLSYNNTGSDFAGNVSGDYNFSKDDTAPEDAGNSIWGDTDGKTPDFVNVGGGTEDFALQSTSDAIGVGTDDPGSGLYSDDINRVARTITWDMGADEHVAVGGVAPTGVLDGPLIGPLGGVIG